jgi:CxxC-x17-CxxC domain-containing protein
MSYVRPRFQIKCDSCGKEDTVPFKPTDGRPVNCKACYEKRRIAG